MTLVERLRKRASEDALVEAGVELGYVGDGQLFADAATELTSLSRANAEMRAALEPFAALADVKGGTPEADKLKAFIVYMLEHNPPGDGVDLIYQFSTACLQARAALASDRKE